MVAKLTPPLKWHGGKHYLARRIVELMPPHVHYVEPYAGGLSVLLAKDPEGVSEVVNDIDRDLTNFWRVLACPARFPAFVRTMQATPYSECEWEDAQGYSSLFTSSVTCAVGFFIFCRQSLAGRMTSFAPLSKRRTRRGMNEQASAWLNAVEGLPAIHERLMRVAIRCAPALQVIAQEDSPDTLFYLDPPYLAETRSAPDVYTHEMTEADHIQLLTALGKVKGKVMLSGYRSELYDDFATAAGWSRHDFNLPNNAASGSAKDRKWEALWCNF